MCVGFGVICDLGCTYFIWVSMLYWCLFWAWFLAEVGYFRVGVVCYIVCLTDFASNFDFGYLWLAV